MKKILTPLAAVIALLGLCASPLFLRVPNRLQQPIFYELHDSCHTFLFFLVNLALLFVLKFYKHRLPNKSAKILHTPSIILIGSSLSLAIGLSIEFIQGFIGRDPSWADMARNTLGIISANVFYTALFVTRQTWLRAVLASTSIGLLIISLAPAYPWIDAQKKRDADFPILMDFDTAETLKYTIPVDNARLRVEPAPAKWNLNQSLVANVFMPKNNAWPGIMLKSPYPDWSQHQWLEMDIYSPHAHSITIILVYYTASNNTSPELRKAYTINPGLNKLRHQLNGKMNEVTKLIVHTNDRKQDIRFYVDNIRLD